MVGGKAKDMANGGADHIGMADHGYDRTGALFAYPVEMAGDAGLHVDHAFAAWRAAMETRFIPAPPGLICMKAFKGPAGPCSKIDFIERGHDLRLSAAALGQMSGGLARPAAGAALQERLMLGDCRSQQFRTALSGFIEPQIEGPAAKDSVESIMLGMSNQ